MDDAERENLIRAGANLVIKALLDMIYADPHQWGTRPCATCGPISRAIGVPFGCVRFKAEAESKQT